MSSILQLFAITTSALPGVLTITQTEIPNELKQDGEKRNAYFIGSFMPQEIIHHFLKNSMFLNSKSHLRVISNYLSNIKFFVFYQLRKVQPIILGFL